MSEKKERTLIIMVAFTVKNTLVVLTLCTVLFLAPTVKSQTQTQKAEVQEQQTKTQEQKSETHEQSPKPEHDQENVPATTKIEDKEEPVKKTKESVELNVDPKPRLKDVIKAARTWGPAYTPWYGKKAPDFTLNDINGKEHKLSDYKGKDVMIIFWATWCGPCIMETPHLIAIRNIISTDELAMLAISNEKPKLVKQFVEDKKINYTVLITDTSDLPAPYNEVNSIPCSFFIDSKGKIKLATEGLLSLGEIKAILQAK